MTSSALSNIKTVESLDMEFDSINAYLQAVHEILQEGHMPDVADLDDRIASLCVNVEKSPPDIQEICLVKLDNLLTRLNECESEMTAFKENAPK